MELPDLGTIGSLATAATVIVALVFGVAQVRLQAAQRRDVTNAEMLSAMLTPDFLDAVDLIQEVPSDATAQTFLADEKLRRAVYLLDFNFEMVGWLVHNRTVSLHDADALFGGIVRLTWRKGRPLIEHDRARLGGPSRGEWLQWLAERMEQDPAPGKAQGAHVAFAKWKR